MSRQSLPLSVSMRSKRLTALRGGKGVCANSVNACSLNALEAPDCFAGGPPCLTDASRNVNVSMRSKRLTALREFGAKADALKVACCLNALEAPDCFAGWNGKGGDQLLSLLSQCARSA